MKQKRPTSCEVDTCGQLTPGIGQINQAAEDLVAALQLPREAKYDLIDVMFGESARDPAATLASRPSEQPNSGPAR